MAGSRVTAAATALKHHQRGGEPDRGQDAQPRDAQGGRGDHDGPTGEDDRGARGGHRVRQGAGVVLASRSVLPVAGDDEQGVVDAHAQPDQAGHGDGGHRHVHRAGHQHDAADGGADGDEGQPDGHDRRDDRPEDDQQHQEGDEQADRGVGRVLLGGVEEDGVASELDLESGSAHAGDGLGQDRERGLADLALGRVERHDGEPDPSVRGDRARRERVGDGLDVGDGGDVVEHLRRSRPRWSSRVVPSWAARTTMAEPLAASGKFSSSSSRACGALAARRGEVVDERAAGRDREEEDGAR